MTEYDFFERMGINMTKPVKLWLWLIVIVSAFQCIWSIMGAFGPTIVLSLIFAAAYAAYAAGGLLLLFPKKKLGFWLVLAAAALNCSLYAMCGAWAYVAGEALFAVVTWMMVKRCWVLFD